VHRAQARFDVAETLAKRELRERHAEKLVEARERTRSSIAAIPPDAPIELRLRQKVHQLSEYDPSGVHPPPSFARFAEHGGRKRDYALKSIIDEIVRKTLKSKCLLESRNELTGQ
jgi:hypothetical protein